MYMHMLTHAHVCMYNTPTHTCTRTHVHAHAHTHITHPPHAHASRPHTLLTHLHLDVAIPHLHARGTHAMVTHCVQPHPLPGTAQSPKLPMTAAAGAAPSPRCCPLWVCSGRPPPVTACTGWWSCLRCLAPPVRTCTSLRVYQLCIKNVHAQQQSMQLWGLADERVYQL